MKKYRYLSLFPIILFFLSFTPIVDAQVVEGNLDTCKIEAFCADDKTTWVKKSGCRLARQFDTGSDRAKEIKYNSGKNCVCNYERLPNSCGNRGGIKDASSNSFEGIFDRVETPPELGSVGNGAGAVASIIQKVIQLMYTAGAVGFIIMFIWNALQMVISGGDKEKVAGARKHITWSIIGITLMALAFPIMRVLETIIGIKFFF